MGRVKELLEEQWNNLTQEQLLDIEYQEWVYNSERPTLPNDYDSSITEQDI